MKQNLLAVFSPVVGDLLTGVRKSDISVDPNGGSGNVLIEDLLLSRAGITTKTSTSTTLTPNDVSTKGTQIILVNATGTPELVIDTDANQNIPLGSQVLVVWAGTGQVKIRFVNGVLLWGLSGGKYQLIQNARGAALLVKIAANSWITIGDLGAPV